MCFYKVQNVMLDLETMGTSADAAIIAIGAVKFNADGIQSEFYINIDLASAQKSGLHIDGDTVKWWLTQSQSARDALLDQQKTLDVGLKLFIEWFKRGNPSPNRAQLWGNGADFDNVILANAYKAAELPQPWNQWRNMCYRTLKNLNKHIEIKRTGTHHNALDDAKSQAQHLINILQVTQ